jgi:molecular chaperone HtpG
MVANIETHQFQAETKQLLDLMIHSLYTTKEIFLRELISNASDALDRLRFEALTTPKLLDEDSRLEIRLEIDREARTLTLSDSGIGMSREEVISHIGTIARSGTRQLREKIKEGASDKVIKDMIGQFGVGFYSAFMVADRIVLATRRAGEETATQWESAGDGHYTISDVEKAGRGTSITLHLKPADPENGIEDFTDKWIIGRTVKRYSDYVSYPIIFRDEREVSVETEEGKEQPEGEASVVEDKVLNAQKPLWTRPDAEVTQEEYTEFYKHISHEMSEPLHYIRAKAEGVLEYQALVFIPSKAPYDLYYHAHEFGLRLYAKGVLIMERCPELLPNYLRFLTGVLDSADLPLNISRQMLQQDRQITQIKKWLTKKTLDALQFLFANDYDKYLKFWKEFGRAFKEGVNAEHDHRDKVVALLLFESSHDAEKLTTLKDYVARMKEDQQEIYYLTGESRSVVENSPHLEAYRDKGYEILYLTDPVDELVAQSLTDFEGKRLKSIVIGKARLGNDEERAQAEQELKQKEEETSDLLKAIQKQLDQHVKDVRLTNRLTTSPACLVGSEMDYSPQLERLLQMGKNGRPKQRRIMELNPQHEIFARMQTRFQEGQDEAALNRYAQLLLGYAFLAEGSELPDPVNFNRLLVEVMTQSL